jgi:hypothetical protein
MNALPLVLVLIISSSLITACDSKEDKCKALKTEATNSVFGKGGRKFPEIKEDWDDQQCSKVLGNTGSEFSSNPKKSKLNTEDGKDFTNPW